MLSKLNIEQAEADEARLKKLVLWNLDSVKIVQSPEYAAWKIAYDNLCIARLGLPVEDGR